MQTIYGSHGAIAPFRLIRPGGAAEAAAALAAAGRDGAALAGGVDLVPALRAGRRLGTLVSLDRIEELRAVRRGAASLWIGAGVTYARLVDDADIRAALPDLAQIWAAVANVRIRDAATLGGNVMAGNPAYDALPALMALDARLVFLGADGRRRTVDPNLEAPSNELLLGVDVPLPEQRRFSFDRGLKPVISVAVALERRGETLSGRAAFGCAHARPAGLSLPLADCADFASVAARAQDIAADAAARLPEPVHDSVAGAAYRRGMAEVLLRRALTALGARA